MFSQKEIKKFAVISCENLIEAKNKGNLFVEPFRHVVVDNFFPTELADLCLDRFPEPSSSDWEHSNLEDIEVKQRTVWESEFDIPDGIAAAVRIMNSSIFLNAMSQIMEIDKVVPDPYFTGGGLNVTKNGGLLDVHVDGNYHDATGLHRRLNAIVYLNPNWEPSWGGEFGIYDDEGKNCIKKVAPLHNRLVIFDSNDKSYHGLPDPVSFPEDDPRRSIILYYYTKEARPSSQVVVDEPHSALWVKKGMKDKRGKKTRDFY